MKTTLSGSRIMLRILRNDGNGNGKFHSQILGTGTEMKIPFPIFGNGNESGKFHSQLLGREWDDAIPENDREREFPLIPALPL